MDCSYWYRDAHTKPWIHGVKAHGETKWRITVSRKIRKQGAKAAERKTNKKEQPQENPNIERHVQLGGGTHRTNPKSKFAVKSNGQTALEARLMPGQDRPTDRPNRKPQRQERTVRVRHHMATSLLATTLLGHCHAVPTQDHNVRQNRFCSADVARICWKKPNNR